MKNFFCAAACVLLVSSTALAKYAPDKYCSETEEHKSALRQTILVVDERDITPEPDNVASEANVPWRRFIVEYLNVTDSAAAQRFAPRERMTLLMARKDGSGVTEFFSGCIPLFSASEMQTIKQSASSFSVFVGSDKASEIKDDQEEFSRAINRSVIAMAREKTSAETLQEGGFVNSPLLQSLSNGMNINQTFGLPRAIIYSSISSMIGARWNTVEEARTNGFAAAREVRIRLNGAEVFLVGASGFTRSAHQQDFLEAFFLGAEAYLKTVTGPGSKPPASPNPTQIRWFTGLAKYPGTDYRVDVRLAVDGTGTLVNSWLILRRQNAPYIPIKGSLTCTSGHCTYLSGDNVFAQIWTTTPNGDPEFSDAFPFGGARTLVFEVDGDTLTGAVSDNQLEIEGLDDNKFHLILNEQKGVRF